MPSYKEEQIGYEIYLALLFKLHNHLNELGIYSNREFSTQVVTYMTSTFIISIIGIFLITKVIFTIKGQFAVIDNLAITFVAWMIFFMLVAYLVLRLCCQAHNESRNTAILVHEIMQKKPSFMLKDDNNYTKMKNFTLQYLHWERYFQFSGTGLFSLDYTFIFSAVSAATSYLIVLLQFDMSAVLENV
ncbi:gustatory and pheromone receptor 33a-like [Condylostylus longicornis]|uniref:gustatory and pheromone receptor 33a-like n=1 Tax=Condylostylus longicornis TaxID=2530218 RepID=UPI00244E16F8|nr:gustatory and pheromone receptor 33a-like [Condylostylus longicornis]